MYMYFSIVTDYEPCGVHK